MDLDFSPQVRVLNLVIGGELYLIMVGMRCEQFIKGVLFSITVFSRRKIEAGAYFGGDVQIMAFLIWCV